MQVQSSDTLLHCDMNATNTTTTTTTTTSLLSPPLTPTSDNQSITEDIPWSVNKKTASIPISYDHYTAMSPPELNSKKGRKNSVIRYQQVMPDANKGYPAKQDLIQCNQFIIARSSKSLKTATMNHRKTIRPKRSLQRDEKSDQRIFQLRVYDTSPSKLLQCSSCNIQPPIMKLDPADQIQYGMNSDEEQPSSTNQFKRRRALSDASESTSKKCKTDAAMAFDRVNVEESDHDFFDPEWIPSYQVFDQRPVRVVWKGKEIISVFSCVIFGGGDKHCNFHSLFLLEAGGNFPRTSSRPSLFLCVPPPLILTNKIIISKKLQDPHSKLATCHTFTSYIKVKPTLLQRCD